MIWGYHYFWKHPNVSELEIRQNSSIFSLPSSQAWWRFEIWVLLRNLTTSLVRQDAHHNFLEGVGYLVQKSSEIVQELCNVYKY